MPIILQGENSGSDVIPISAYKAPADDYLNFLIVLVFLVVLFFILNLIVSWITANSNSSKKKVDISKQGTIVPAVNLSAVDLGSSAGNYDAASVRTVNLLGQRPSSVDLLDFYKFVGLSFILPSILFIFAMGMNAYDSVSVWLLSGDLAVWFVYYWIKEADKRCWDARFNESLYGYVDKKSL